MLSNLLKKSQARNQGAGGAPPPPKTSVAVLRIRKDLEQLQLEEIPGPPHTHPTVYVARSLPPGTRLSMDRRNPYELRVTFTPGEESVWAGEELNFLLVLSEQYPFTGPRARYTGPFRLLHPNVECGRFPREETISFEEEDAAVQVSGGWGVCLGIQMEWRPAYTLLDLLLGLWVLLDHPNTSDPLPGVAKVIAPLLEASPQRYAQLAREWLRGHYIALP